MPNSFLVFKILFYSNHKTGTQQAISISIIQCYASFSYLAGSNQIEVLIDCSDERIGRNNCNLALVQGEIRLNVRFDVDFFLTVTKSPYMTFFSSSS